MCPDSRPGHRSGRWTDDLVVKAIRICPVIQPQIDPDFSCEKALMDPIEEIVTDDPE